MNFSQRAADRMKAALSTWTALFGVLVFIGLWMATDGAGLDPPPWIGLNLILSCFAALQCFVLLIAAKRSDQLATDLAHQTFVVSRDDLIADQDTNALLRQLLAELRQQSEQSGA